MSPVWHSRGRGLFPLRALELPGWKTALSWVASLLVSFLFLIPGLWMITDAPDAAMHMAQARVPESLSLVAAVALGIAETIGGVLVLVPRFRRWGAILTSALLVVFLAYFALNYHALRGAECSCFPWVKRAVNPAFFAEDGLMLGLAILAGLWSRRPESPRSAVMVVGAVLVFALVSYGVDATRLTGIRAPDTISVDARPYSLQRGKIFIFFFDPMCAHCFDAARRMAQYRWGDTKVVAVPVEQPQYAAQFLLETGLSAAISNDFGELKQALGYTGYPFGVALQNGRERASLIKFEDQEPGVTLKQLGFIY
ncbi:MAG TPA: MauE/DoxX family redox-associated membrane protein [Bryobacteraceae bacterium]|nr:MauE/DoxX family redox-associated membrane protein [Bryobacteraceae bacterium]